ncbi:autotransporter assembly complex family protein [Colwellia asteriadis]
MTYCKLILTCLLGLLLFNNVYANNLTVTLNGEMPKAVRKNIYSHLGQLPNTELERSAFIYSAKNSTRDALNALGYYRADISSQITYLNKQDKSAPQKLALTINIGKATIVDKVHIIINGEAFNDSAFQALLTQRSIKQGDTLNHSVYSTLKSDILSLALRRGYFDGKFIEHKITIKDDHQYADITLLYESGPRYKFGHVNFNDFDLEPALLKSLVPFKPEQYYSAKAFHQLQQQLQASQYFGNILALPGEKIIVPEKHQFLVPINVTVTPAKSHLFDFGLGYATDTLFRVSAGWRTPKLNKYGHFQETRFKYSSVNATGKFIYSIPISHPTNDLLQFKVMVEDDEYADLDTKFHSIQIGRLSNKNNWQRELYTRLHEEAWQYNLDENTPNLRWSEVDKVSYVIPGITWSSTTRAGSPLDPSEGFRQTYNIEGAHLNAGSDNSFFRVHGKWNYITTLAPKHRLVTRAELGAVFIDRDAQLAPSLRFYAGGDQSIRGFAYQSIASTIPASSDPNDNEEIVVGSTRLFVASIEYQYYLTEKWRVAMFSDGGSANNKGEFEPVYSIGSGLHYMSPVGPIKIDVAYGIDGEDKNWRLHFSLGAEL